MTTLTKSDLDQFSGTGCWFRHGLTGMVYTEGVQHLAERGGAYWLIDNIAIAQAVRAIGEEPFQVWTLDVSDCVGVLTCTDGGKAENAGEPVILYEQHIPFTDFPLDTVTLWVEGPVILLPSEH